MMGLPRFERGSRGPEPRSLTKLSYNPIFSAQETNVFFCVQPNYLKIPILRFVYYFFSIDNEYFTVFLWKPYFTVECGCNTAYTAIVHQAFNIFT
jgi:hypothetical protein